MFFLCFAAIFNGLPILLSFFVLGFGLGGVLLAQYGGLRPLHAAAALSAPAVPWVLWLWPASIPEAGWLRASLWPLMLCVVFALGYAGAALARLLPKRP